MPVKIKMSEAHIFKLSIWLSDLFVGCLNRKSFQCRMTLRLHGQEDLNLYQSYPLQNQRYLVKYEHAILYFYCRWGLG